MSIIRKLNPSYKNSLRMLLPIAVQLICLDAHASLNDGRCTDVCEFQISYIQGEGDVQGAKLALYMENSGISGSLQGTGLDLSVGFELSANYWRFGPENQSDYNSVIAFSPILTTPIGSIGNKPVMLEFGVGLSLLDDTRFAGKNVSTHYQFEDRIGLIFQIDRFNKINLRYLHYSNAGFKSPNPGLDFISTGYQFIF